MKYPFKFLDAYGHNDKDIFFGRDEEIEALYKMVFQTNLMLVYGASGTGKTSLIRCGLANKFKSSQWLDLYIRRGDNINESLLETIKKRTPQAIATTIDDEDDWFEDLINDDVNTNEQQADTQLFNNLNPTAQALNELYLATFTPIYLIFDQFEEVFTIGTEEEQKEIIKTIEDLVKLSLPVKIIIAIREEYLAKLYDLEQAIPQLRNKRLRIEPMNVQRVESIILNATNHGLTAEKPNQNANIYLEKGKEKEIAKEIVNKIREGDVDIQLPYLQVFMDRLYEEATGEPIKRTKTATLTLELVNGLGKIGDILVDFLNRQSKVIRKTLNKKYQNLPDDIVWKILSPFATADGTKKPIPQHNLYLIEESLSNKKLKIKDFQAFIKDAITELERSRILRFRRESQTYEVYHDTLAKQIVDQRSEDEKAYLKAKRIVSDGYAMFADTKTLLSREQIAFINPFQRRLKKEISSKALAYLKKSIVRRRWFFIATLLFVIALLAAAAFVVYTTNQQKNKLAASNNQLTESNYKNEKLVNAFYFFDDRLALAFKYDMYGFIDILGNPVINYKYDQAQQFDYTGFAPVTRKGQNYFIDSTGKEYKVAYNLDELNSSTLALDLRNVPLKEFPEKILKNKQLQVLMLYGDSTNNKTIELPNNITNIKKLKHLYIENFKIEDIQPLSKLTNLEVLNLRENNISNIQPLRKLRNLKVLNLRKNKITNINTLKYLKQLKVLSLIANVNISDISVLKELTNLETLYLNENNISDLKPLANLTKLEIAYLNNNNIENLEPIQNLTTLKELFLEDNKIKEINSLRKLTTLKALKLTKNKISDINSLENLIHLQILHLSNNQVKDISPLRKLKRLEVLFIGNNQIIDISPLEDLTELRILLLNNGNDGKNNIKNIDALAKLKNLQTLNLNRNTIEDISVLKNFTNLYSLHLNNVNAKNFDVLQDLTSLENLSLKNNNLTDITFLRNLVSLQELSLNNNKIESLEPLRKLVTVLQLDLTNNKITSLKYVETLVSLQRLKLNKNSITNIELLKKLTNLEELSLNNAPTMKKQVEDLQNTLPNCRIALIKKKPNPKKKPKKKPKKNSKK